MCQSVGLTPPPVRAPAPSSLASGRDSLDGMRKALLVLAAVAGTYFVARGVTELVMVDYGNPASYRHDWGGPSLLGVLAVHCGPGIVSLVGLAYALRSGKLVRK